MYYNSTKRYIDLVQNLSMTFDIPKELKNSLMNATLDVFEVEQQKMYAEPTSWIGWSIVAASLFCIFAMAADLLHGLRNRKLWFPCKYFTINAAFLSVISVSMKLPMDITTSMPGDVDQVTKLGSMAFLCTMMANLLPSLATMNSKELLTNIIGLGVMVITLVVNICIQIQTGVVSYNENGKVMEAIQPLFDLKSMGIFNKNRNSIIAAVYVTLLLVLLIIHICSSLAILKFKKKIGEKYQEIHEKLHETILKEPQADGLTVEKLQQHVRKYWIMAGTGSPQFITICSVTTSTCGVICVLSTALHVLTLFWTIDSVKRGDYKSDYKWTMLVIFVIQFIGVILGTIVPLCRCFATLCFKVSIKSIKTHINVFKVESYWIQQLYDWKQESIALPFHCDKCSVISEHVKNFFLKFCIEFQDAVVKTCKIISLVPVCIVYAIYCLKCLKNKGKVVVSSKGNEKLHDESGNKIEDPEDFRQYVLQLEDEMEISGTTLEWLSRYTKCLIKKGERRQPKDLLEVIKKYRCFKGDEIFDYYCVASLRSKKYQDCWSLTMVTLTTIAVSLPNINKSESDELLKIVKEGLVYVTQVEQSLHTTDGYVRIQKAARTLWNEFKVHKTWLNNNMKEIASQKNTTREIFPLFKEMVKKVGVDNGIQDDNSIRKSICADSMDCIINILLSNTECLSSNQQLFEHISQVIYVMFVACLNNLPKVIIKKCHTSEIEKREACVEAAIKLLGETTQIINTFQDRDLTCLNPKGDTGSSNNEGQHL